MTFFRGWYLILHVFDFIHWFYTHQSDLFLWDMIHKQQYRWQNNFGSLVDWNIHYYYMQYINSFIWLLSYYFCRIICIAEMSYRMNIYVPFSKHRDKKLLRATKASILESFDRVSHYLIIEKSFPFNWLDIMKWAECFFTLSRCWPAI